MARIVDRLRSFPQIADVRVVVGDSTYNRYLYGRSADEAIIYTQDDDCLTDIGPILEAYEPGIIVNAMTREHAARYRGAQTLIGFGSIFDRSLIDTVMDSKWERDDLFFSKADRIFGTINQHKTVFPKIEILPHATDDNRLYRQKNHGHLVAAMNRRIFELTGIRA